MWKIYILQSQKSGRYYIGSTNDISRRLKEHNSGKTKSTKNKGPWEIIYTENFSNRLEARRREKMIKSYKGGNAFKSLVKRS